MEFKIARAPFLEALSRLQGVVERKNTMPILSNILLDADQNGLRLSATDLEVSLISLVPAQVTTQGKITVLARSLHDIVRELNQIELQISVKENDRIEIKAGRSQFNIPGLAAKEFPQLPQAVGKSTTIPAETFQDMLEKCVFAMASDETRHNLAGIHVQAKKSGPLRLVATDGHRLSLVEKDLLTEAWQGVNIIIPRKGVQELRKIMGREGEFELAIGEKTLSARKGNDTLIVRLIEGEFPDYQRVIPQDNDKFANVSKEALVGSLRRVSLLSNEKSKGVVVKLSSGHLEVSTNNPDLGEAQEEIEVDYKGESMTIGFNARYMLDALSVLRDETVVLALKSDLAPCMIKAEKDSGYLAVIMPMRI